MIKLILVQYVCWFITTDYLLIQIYIKKVSTAKQ